jgi:hypothetical protein
MSILDGKTPQAVASPGVPVTQQMRDEVLAMVSDEMMQQSSETRKLKITDDVVRLVHVEMSRDESAEHRVTNRELAWMVFWDCNHITISEYIALKPWHAPVDDFQVAKDIVRGLHCPERNKMPLDVSDPKSVERNVALLKSAMLIHEMGYEGPVEEALNYSKSIDGKWMGHGFGDPNCSDLIIDNPEYCETLIRTIQQRGYDNGLAVFRDMLATASPALMEGVL